MNKNNKIKTLFLSVSFILIMLFAFNASIASERPLRCAAGMLAIIDPAAGRSMESIRAFCNLYDPLVFPDKDGKAQPHVAKSWDVSSDGRTWTVHIREGIKFHDGTELQASDVKYSMDRLRRIGEGVSYLFLAQEIEIEVVDNYTVKFHLERPEGVFIEKCVNFYIVNEDLVRENTEEEGPYGEMGDYGKGYLLEHDAGSGAYMVKEFVAESYMDTVIYPDYWLPIDPNAPDAWKVIQASEPITIETLLRKREIEMSLSLQSEETLKRFDQIEGIDVTKYNMASHWNLPMHTRKPPTDDIHFRKAIAWAIDYEGMIKYLFPGAKQIRGNVHPMVWGHDPTVFQYHRDLDKAREELKKSKYYDSLDQYPVEIYWITSDLIEEQIALAVMSYLGEIGITVDIKPMTWLGYSKDSSMIETTPNMFMFYESLRWPEALAQLDYRFMSSSAAGSSQVEWLLDPVYDAMVDEVAATLDEEKRLEIYSKMQHYIVDLCPTIWICDNLTKTPYQSAYIEWYAAIEQPCPLTGYDLIMRNIKVYPEKREELLKN